ERLELLEREWGWRRLGTTGGEAQQEQCRADASTHHEHSIIARAWPCEVLGADGHAGLDHESVRPSVPPAGGRRARHRAKGATSFERRSLRLIANLDPPKRSALHPRPPVPGELGCDPPIL